MPSVFYLLESKIKHRSGICQCQGKISFVCRCLRSCNNYHHENIQLHISFSHFRAPPKYYDDMYLKRAESHHPKQNK